MIFLRTMNLLSIGWNQKKIIHRKKRVPKETCYSIVLQNDKFNWTCVYCIYKLNWIPIKAYVTYYVIYNKSNYGACIVQWWDTKHMSYIKWSFVSCCFAYEMLLLFNENIYICIVASIQLYHWIVYVYILLIIDWHTKFLKPMR